jgi:hypothetical protein
MWYFIASQCKTLKIVFCEKTGNEISHLSENILCYYLTRCVPDQLLLFSLVMFVLETG